MVLAIVLMVLIFFLPQGVLGYLQARFLTPGTVVLREDE
jgi:hypothetical protein